jgi:glycosyltransferase involved in cell wall biosynthesis
MSLTTMNIDMNKKLNILIVNWTWFPSGGDWTYIENISKFYQSKGHEVIPFSMHDERNLPSPYSDYFINKINYKELNRKKTALNGLKTLRNTTYSFEAKTKLKMLLDKHPVDVVHLNNIHHYLTPASIIPEFKKRNIPIIWTLHDYVILCPNTTFTSNDKICEKCKGGKFYKCITNKCKKQSVQASFVAAMEAYTNQILNPYKYVDYFICPSDFILKKFVAFGFNLKKLIQIYNLFDIVSVHDSRTPASVRSDKRPYIVYAGRIEKVKGVFTMARAIADQNADLYILGNGESFDELKKMITDEGWSNIYLLGKLTKEEVFGYIQNASFITVPSEWYENLPYSLIEALLLSKPVLGADIGGIPELVINGFTGFLFKPGDADDMRSKALMMLSDPDKLKEMGCNARTYITGLVNYDAYGEKLSKVYDSLELAL